MSQRYLGGVITANPTTPTMTTESGVWTLEQQFQYTTTWSPKIVGDSVRLRSSATAYFSRTPASTTNQKIYTWSGWIKLGALANGGLFEGYSSGTNLTALETAAGTLVFQHYIAGTYNLVWQTTAVYRDPSAWYHVVLFVDMTQASSTNAVKIYVNGVSQALTFTAYTGAYAANINTYINTASVPQHIGLYQATPAYFDGYFAEINFVDGQALTPSSFGAYDSTGTWQPLPYTGTYGTNGFYLTFADNSAATAAALGKDTSGNGNNWTPNNISLTAGTTYDWMLDTPTNSDNGGTGRGNYAVFNPLAVTSVAATFADGNLKVTTGLAGGNGYGTFAIPSSGKWYWEITANSGNSPMIGVSDYLSTQTYAWQNTNSVFYYNTGQKYIDGTGTTYGATYTTNDVIGVAVDADAGTITFYKNNTSQGSISHAMAGLYPCLADGSSVTTDTFSANFGQRPFTYTPPTGFKALNTQNLPDPNITNGAQYMAATTYTGTGATRSVSNGANNTIGTTFQPDFIWIKDRSVASAHALTNSVAGFTKYLESNTTLAETTDTTSVTAVSSSGFTLGAGTATYYTNRSGESFVAWQWQAGQGTTSSNTSGSITSTVSVNTKAGFSVVTYTGNGTNGATVGHGLGVTPAMVIYKARGTPSGVNGNWLTWHSSVSQAIQSSTTIALTGFTGALYLNLTSSSSTYGFDNQINQSSLTYVAYCWAAVAGYSAFGSYTGNGSTDGTFVYLGFRPRFLMVKRTDTTSNWVIVDSSRNVYNPQDLNLYPNLSAAEDDYTTTYPFDMLSNGVKFRANYANVNASGGTYIYAAFAENPFKISRAR